MQIIKLIFYILVKFLVFLQILVVLVAVLPYCSRGILQIPHWNFADLMPRSATTEDNYHQPVDTVYNDTIQNWCFFIIQQY